MLYRACRFHFVSVLDHQRQSPCTGFSGGEGLWGVLREVELRLLTLYATCQSSLKVSALGVFPNVTRLGSRHCIRHMHSLSQFHSHSTVMCACITCCVIASARPTCSYTTQLSKHTLEYNTVKMILAQLAADTQIK